MVVKPSLWKAYNAQQICLWQAVSFVYQTLDRFVATFFGFTQMVCAKVKIISNGFSDYLTRTIVKLPLDNTHVLPVYNGGHYWRRRLTRCCSPYLWTIQKKILVGTAREAALFHHSSPLLAHSEPATSTHGEPATSTQAELTLL